MNLECDVYTRLGLPGFAFAPSFHVEYKPSDEEIKTFCLNMKFAECPRYQAILEILKSTQSK